MSVSLLNVNSKNKIQKIILNLYRKMLWIKNNGIIYKNKTIMILLIMVCMMFLH